MGHTFWLEASYLNVSSTPMLWKNQLYAKHQLLSTAFPLSSLGSFHKKFCKSLFLIWIYLGVLHDCRFVVVCMYPCRVVSLKAIDCSKYFCMHPCPVVSHNAVDCSRVASTHPCRVVSLKAIDCS